MTHYLRDENNITIVDIETTETDLHCVILVKPLYNFIIRWISNSKKEEVIEDFSKLQEIRRDYFESLGKKKSPREFVTEYLKVFIKKYFNYLIYVTD